MADIFDPVVCLKFIDATIVEYLTREITPRSSNPLMKVTNFYSKFAKRNFIGSPNLCNDQVIKYISFGALFQGTKVRE